MINQQLRDHTTQIAFHLTLSRSMIGALQHVKMDELLFDAGIVPLEDRMQKCRDQGTDMGSFYVSGWKALESRGLVYKPEQDAGKHWSQQLQARLTPAGERVWDLLVMAGVVADLQVPANLLTAKKRNRA